jgi:rubrerythrin
MPQITAKELGLLSDRLSMERNLVGKYRSYAADMTDSSLKTKCEELADRHQKHLDALYMELK